MAQEEITLSRPPDLIKQAEVYAAERETTVSALVQELLQQKFTDDSRMLDAANRLIARAHRAPHFSGEPGAIRREELHKRD